MLSFNHLLCVNFIIQSLEMTQHILTIICICFTLNINAQDTLRVDTILSVSELEILGKQLLNDEARANMVIARNMDNPSANAFNNLSDILQSNNYLFLKSYGLGSLATPSTGGTGASHTAVVWNGFNLQSPMNGTLDLSLMPVEILDDVTLEKVGASSKYGSGAVGGAIVVDNPTQFKKKKAIYFKSNIGSFESYRQSVDIQIGQQKFQNRTRLFNHSAQNNFKYINRNLFGRPEVEQTNAALQQRGFLQENAIKINKSQQIQFKVWYQDSHRKLPPSSIQSESVAFQDDRFTRWFGHYQYVGQKSAIHLSTAYFDEYLRYSDESVQLDDTSRSTNWLNKLEAYFYLKNNQTLKVGTQYNYLSAFSEGYNGSFDQNQVAVFVQYLKTHQKYNIDAVVREEMVNGATNPLSGYLKFEFHFNSKWSAVSSVSNNYRLPTFNDLYWSVGGNPNLKPEWSWSEYVGISHQLKNKQTTFSSQISIFNKNINNWILWRPVGPIWSPENIKSVWSRGVEVHQKIDWKIRKNLLIQAKISYDFIKSTNQKVADNAQNTLHQQLIYVPLHQANGQVALVYKHFYFKYNQQFVGRRYITTSNSDWLSGYSIADILANYNFQYKKIKINIYSRINNLWNVNYEVVQSRPMPRRNFQIGVSIGVNEN